MAEENKNFLKDFASGLLAGISEQNPIFDALYTTPEEKFQEKQRAFRTQQMADYEADAPIREARRRQASIELQEFEEDTEGRKLAREAKNLKNREFLEGSETRKESRALASRQQRAQTKLTENAVTTSDIRTFNTQYNQNQTLASNRMQTAVKESAQKFYNLRLNQPEMNAIMQLPAVQNALNFESMVATAMENEADSKTMAMINSMDQVLGIDIYRNDEGDLEFLDLETKQVYDLNYENIIRVHNLLNQRVMEEVKPFLQWDLQKTSIGGRTMNWIATGLMSAFGMNPKNLGEGLNLAKNFMRSQRTEDLQRYALMRGLGEYLYDGTLTKQEKQQLLPELAIFADELGIKYEDSSDGIMIVQDDGSRMPLQNFYNEQIQQDVIGRRLQQIITDETVKREQNQARRQELQTLDTDAARVELKEMDVQEAVAPLNIEKRLSEILTGPDTSVENVEPKVDALKLLRDQWNTIAESVRGDDYSEDELRAARVSGIETEFPGQKELNRLEGLLKSLKKYEKDVKKNTYGMTYYKNNRDLVNSVADGFNINRNRLATAMRSIKKRPSGSKIDMLKLALEKTGVFKKGALTKEMVRKNIPRNFR